MDTVGERKSGTNGEGSIETYRHSQVSEGQLARLLGSAGSPGGCSAVTWRDGDGGGDVVYNYG